jgi:hypothetical protein
MVLLNLKVFIGRIACGSGLRAGSGGPINVDCQGIMACESWAHMGFLILYIDWVIPACRLGALQPKHLMREDLFCRLLT